MRRNVPLTEEEIAGFCRAFSGRAAEIRGRGLSSSARQVYRNLTHRSAVRRLEQGQLGVFCPTDGIMGAILPSGTIIAEMICQRSCSAHFFGNGDVRYSRYS